MNHDYLCSTGSVGEPSKAKQDMPHVEVGDDRGLPSLHHDSQPPLQTVPFKYRTKLMLQ